MSIKEFFTSYYDESKGVIFNASPNTLIYFHEEGHQMQDKNGKLGLFKMYFGLSLYLTVAFLVGENGYFAYIAFVFSLVLFFYIEIDAWVYAFRRKYERKKTG